MPNYFPSNLFLWSKKWISAYQTHGTLKGVIEYWTWDIVVSHGLNRWDFQIWMANESFSRTYYKLLLFISKTLNVWQTVLSSRIGTISTFIDIGVKRRGFKQTPLQWPFHHAACKHVPVEFKVWLSNQLHKCRGCKLFTHKQIGKTRKGFMYTISGVLCFLSVIETSKRMFSFAISENRSSLPSFRDWISIQKLK